MGIDKKSRDHSYLHRILILVENRNKNTFASLDVLRIEYCLFDLHSFYWTKNEKEIVRENKREEVNK